MAPIRLSDPVIEVKVAAEKAERLAMMHVLCCVCVCREGDKGFGGEDKQPLLLS